MNLPKACNNIFVDFLLRRVWSDVIYETDLYTQTSSVMAFLIKIGKNKE